jgi:hypothetical protein
LTNTAQEVDQGYPDNDQLTIDAHGEPHLKRYQRPPVSPTALALAAAVQERMPERSVLGMLHRAVCRTNCTRHFGPRSGREPGLERPQERYILTTFAYGCNLGPRQAARHMPGQIDAQQFAYINRRHIDSRTLMAAMTDIINHTHRGRLPALWGDDKVVGAVDVQQYCRDHGWRWHLGVKADPGDGDGGDVAVAGVYRAVGDAAGMAHPAGGCPQARL